MAFFENFHESLGRVPAEIMEPLRQQVASVGPDSAMVLGRSDTTLAEGTYIPMIYQGRPLNTPWCEHTQPVVDYVSSLDLPCIRGYSLFKTELSIVPPGGALKWHHDIYLKDKITERIHVPVVTNPDTVFFAKWFTDENVYAFKMAQDGIYRLNNRVPHMVKNGGTITRFHLLLNYARKDIMDLLLAQREWMESVEPSPGSSAQRAIRAVTPADETYYFVNHAPKGVFKLDQKYAVPPLHRVRIERLLTNVNAVSDM